MAAERLGGGGVIQGQQAHSYADADATEPPVVRLAPPPWRRALHAQGGMRRPVDQATLFARQPARVYISTHHKFFISGLFSLCWVALSVWISLPWIGDASRLIGLAPAVIMISCIAFLPGSMVAFLSMSLLLDRQPRFRDLHPTTAADILIAARNEEAGIGQTIEYLSRQDYEGPLCVVLADNGSTDRTVELARAAATAHGVNLRIVHEATPGKSHALNKGLEVCTSPLVITVDADTLLHPSAVRLLIARLESSPEEVVAVAGTVLVRNGRASFWSKLQEWDYFLGIASVKRMQGLFQSTLVAQGAFSLYRADAVRRVGGWPDAIGEDILLTWQLLHREGLVYFEPLSVAFTTAPENLKAFARQRSRWARGMLEGLKSVPPWRHSRYRTAALAFTNLAIPLVDLGYTFIWLPGLALAFTGRYYIVGPMTLAVLPLTFVVYWVLYRQQRDRVFAPLGLQVRRNRAGLLLFIVLYQPVMSLVSVMGYGQELLHLRRRWR